jgi:hypothetical protein
VTLAGFLHFTGQGWLQLAELTLAFALSALVGLERGIRQKSAGLRTHTLVGVSAALFMLVLKYGFMNILVNGRVVLDPSRIESEMFGQPTLRAKWKSEYGGRPEGPTWDRCRRACDTAARIAAAAGEAIPPDGQRSDRKP